jgi:hypothetical protein
VSLVPPDPPLSDGVIILRPLDENDLPTIEQAASDAEILKWFDLHTRGSADYLAAKREAWAEGTGLPSPSATRLGPLCAWAKSFIERDDDGRASGRQLDQASDGVRYPRQDSVLDDSYSSVLRYPVAACGGCAGIIA